MFKYSAQIFASLVLILAPPLVFASEIPSYKNKNPNLWTAQESMDSWKDHLKNQERYAKAVQNSHKEVIAGIQMGVEGKQNVQQMLERASTLYDGSKITEKAVITQTPNKSKVAEVLTNRWKQAKSLGKASLPTFVGMAAFHGLIEGIGWVMDEGGVITMTPETPIINSPYVWNQSTSFSGQQCVGNFVTSSQAIDRFISCANKAYPNFSGSHYCSSLSSTSIQCFVKYGDPNYIHDHYRINYISNPIYDPSSNQPDPVVLDYSEIQIALQQALLNNNAMQAAMIAEAIKDAYSYDKSQSNNPASNTLAKEAAQDAEKAIEQAYKNPKPNTDPKRPSGYYKLEDHETGKIVEGYVEPSPIGGTNTSVTTPDLDPVTGQPTGTTTTTGESNLPAFCDWASVMCEWYEWTTKDEIPEDEQETEAQEDPLVLQEIEGIDWQALCPEPEIITFTLHGHTEEFKILDLTHACEFAPIVKAVVIFGSTMQGLYILAGIRTKGGDDE